MTPVTRTRWPRRWGPVPASRAAGILLAGILLAGLPATASPVITVCLDVIGDVPGLPWSEARDALLLEWRKAGIDTQIRVETDPVACEDAVPAARQWKLIIGPEIHALLDGGTRCRQAWDLAEISPLDRAQELARQVVSVMSTGCSDIFTAVVEDDLPIMQPETVKRPGVDPRYRAYVQVGGRYDYQVPSSAHAAGADLEFGLQVFDGRLETGARLGWARLAKHPSMNRDAVIQAVPAAAVVRGGLRFGAVLVRLGFVCGIEWRHLHLGASSMSDALSRTSLAVDLGLETDVTLDVGRGVRLSVVGLVRGFVGGTGYTLHGESIYKAPRYAAGVAFRVGYVLPGLKR